MAEAGQAPEAPTPQAHVALDVAAAPPPISTQELAEQSQAPVTLPPRQGSKLELGVHRVEGALVTSMVSPIVRMRLVDAATGYPITKTPGQHCVFNLDADSQPYIRQNKGMQKFQRLEGPWFAFGAQSSAVVPWATMPCRMQRSRGGAQRDAPQWDEGFLLADPPPHGSAILFEVLDARVAQPGPGEDAPHLELTPVAWGFLNVDAALPLRGRARPRRLRIQLYKFRRRHQRRRQEEEADEVEAPPVIQDYLSAGFGAAEDELPGKLASLLASFTGRGRQPWPASLEVTLSPPQKTVELERVAEALSSQAANESRISVASEVSEKPKSPTKEEEKAQPEDLLGHLAPHNLRNDGQVCMLPDSLLWQISAGKRGASRLALSPSSTLIAAAVARQKGSTELRVYSLTTGRLYATCASGHDSMVYDLCWHGWSGRKAVDAANPLLISCGGDGSVLIYEVPEDLVPLPGSSAPHLRLHTRISLPSHVYSVRPHPSLSADPRRLVLLCGGHRFGLMICEISRTWKQVEGGLGGSWVATTPHAQQQIRYEVSQRNSETQGLPDVLCVRFSTQANSLDSLYVTDAAGHVMLFQVRFDASPDAGRGGLHASMVRSYASQELAGKAIYGLEVVTQQLVQGRRLSSVQLSMVDDWVLLFARDHIVRLASLQRGVLKVELQMLGIQCGSFPVHGTISPDGAYVACGSETGELCIWGAVDGKPLPPSSVPQVRLAGPMMDVVWSERHHLLGCCALDDEAPPLLFFVGGNPEALPAPTMTRGVEIPHRPAPLRDAPREESMNASSISPAVAADHKWAHQWIDADHNPRSAITMEEKRRMKENILLRILDKKGADDVENHFASVRALPGGL
mmetsp:Transcript_20137/g.35744  ORF Transcript_20137/g.35744 Transcript_20137/m.35744 type:complete len:857 (+) Transcript_20137:93-2663(+)|eukprot:CAMPEP_0197629140 /NCGR_PEP_ID=MMETSP1338-20131121/7124_1 /TAXON_ID=43686 ORGANISM="Pelagodinium beii, Strain RCC1491" /NCGR_SAMPLE_ID=MMETSP1338 /ASSEMBLY_ACC=CAM_ASM_000754 /LENGTH=856 /DNA_ID=CAMNT_0043200157 /DNA_START=93 /DNA_END=2663 /DNA_ORIENTATION=-